MADRCTIGGFTQCGVSYQVCRGEASTATEKRLYGIVRCNNWYSLEGQVMCNLYFGDGSDGNCVISENKTLPARTYNFENLTICPNVKVDFSGGNAVPIIKAQGYICNQGTIDLRSCDCIYGCKCTYLLLGDIENKATKCKLQWTSSGGAAGSGGAGGNFGRTGCGFSSYAGGACCCCNGGGGAGINGNGCAANVCCGGNGGAGGGGGYGCCSGGNGGNVGICGIGGNGGNGCYGGGNGGCGGTCYCCVSKGGCGGNTIWGCGGAGGNAATSHNKTQYAGNGGFSIWGTGGKGGDALYGWYYAATYGGKGGDTMYGTGGAGGNGCWEKGGCTSCHSNTDRIGGAGGNATGGQYGLILIAPCVVNTCIVGCGGNGGAGGNGNYQTSSYYTGYKASGGIGGYGGMGADVKIYYECCLVSGTICNCGGCGGCGGASNEGYVCNGADGANGTTTICQISFT